MSLIAEFHLSGPEIALTPALEAVPEMTVQVEQLLAEDPTQPLIFVWASGDDFETFEEAVTEDETVSEFTLVESLPNERLYRFRIAPEADVVFYPMDIEVGAARLDVTATYEGLDMRMRFPDQEALQEYFDRCREADVSVSLNRLYRGEEGSTASDTYGLSPKQRNALEEAYLGGFYDIPRDASLADVAVGLDISEQAVSERLRRATASLIENTLAPERE